MGSADLKRDGTNSKRRSVWYLRVGKPPFLMRARARHRCRPALVWGQASSCGAPSAKNRTSTVFALQRTMFLLESSGVEGQSQETWSCSNVGRRLMQGRHWARCLRCISAAILAPPEEACTHAPPALPTDFCLRSSINACSRRSVRILFGPQHGSPGLLQMVVHQVSKDCRRLQRGAPYMELRWQEDPRRHVQAQSKRA